jgi:hypothetical protein
MGLALYQAVEREVPSSFIVETDTFVQGAITLVSGEHVLEGLVRQVYWLSFWGQQHECRWGCWACQEME